LVEVKFPALKIPAFRLTRGQLLNIWLLGASLVIPPWDITFWEETTLTKELTLFKTEDITNVLLTPINAVPKAVWDLLKTTLDDMAKDFYERHSEEKT